MSTAEATAPTTETASRSRMPRFMVPAHQKTARTTNGHTR